MNTLSSKDYNIIIGVMVGVTILIVVMLIILFVYLSKNKKPLLNPGEVCTSSSECKSGLNCQQNICVIPEKGSCAEYPTFCMSGTTCINNICDISPEARSLQAQKQIKFQNQLTSLQSLQATTNSPSNYSVLYVSRCIDDPNPVEFYVEPFKDAVVYTDIYGITRIYILRDNLISAYNLNGTLYKTYQSNIPITTKLEVVGNNVYTIYNNLLYKANINDFQFSNQNEIVYDIIPNSYGTKLFQQTDVTMDLMIPGLNNDAIYYNNQYFYYTDNQGQRVQNLLNNKYPIYYNGQIYLMSDKTKVYNDYVLIMK